LALERAADFARACAELGVGWLEGPLDMYAYDEQAKLCRRSEVPVAGAELNGGWQEFKVMLEKSSHDIYQPDATIGGGIGDARRVLDACRERGLGFLINRHVYAAGPRDYPIKYPYEPPGWVPEARDGILAEPIRVASDVMVAVPAAPGPQAEAVIGAIDGRTMLFWLPAPVKNTALLLGAVGCWWRFDGQGGYFGAPFRRHLHVQRGQ
jgi:D-galactarolactone cycloisomerase